MWELFRVGFQLSGLLFLLLRSNRARKLLRAELALCPGRPREERAEIETGAEAGCPDVLVAGSSFLGRYYLRLDLSDQWIDVLRDASFKFGYLLRYRRGASVLAFAVATHVMAAALAVALLAPLTSLALIALPLAAVAALMFLVCMRRAKRLSIGPARHSDSAGITARVVCHECDSSEVVRREPSLWVTAGATLGFFLVCFLSLFMLLVESRSRCLECGQEFD